MASCLYRCSNMAAMIRVFTGGSLLVLNGADDPDSPIPPVTPVPEPTDQIASERRLGLPQVAGFSVEYNGKMNANFGVSVDENLQQ